MSFQKGNKINIGNKYNIGKKYSENHCKNISLSKIGKKRIDMIGKKNPNWKGGMTPFNKQMYMEKYNKEYRQTPGFKEKKKEYNKRYYQRGGIVNKIKLNLHTRIWKVLKGKSKSARTAELIGCSINYFLDYIESQFDDTMSWANYGAWHLDHIIPCASFDLSEEEEQRKCFNYTNIQPLWAEDNMIKGRREIPCHSIM